MPALQELCWMAQHQQSLSVISVNEVGFEFELIKNFKWKLLSCVGFVGLC